MEAVGAYATDSTGVPLLSVSQEPLAQRPEIKASTPDRSRSTALPAPASLHCQVCRKQFPSMRSLKVHQGRMHKELGQMKGTFDRALDAVAGMPICRWCGVKFLHWPGLQLHHVSLACSGQQRIEQGAAPVVNVAEAIRFRPLAQRLLGPEPMHELLLDEHELKDLSEHCIICHQWTNRPTSLSKYANTHLRRCDLAQARRVYASQIPLAKFTSPCQWCKRPFVDSKHTCLVFWQRALLQVWTSASSATVEQDGTESGTVRTNVSTARDRHDIGTFDGETRHANRSQSRIPTKEAERCRVIRRRRCRQKTRPYPADGAPLLAPRGCPQHFTTRHKFRPLRSNTNRRCDAVHFPIIACSGSSMEASKRVQRRQCPSSQCASPNDDRGTSQESWRDQIHEAGGRELQEADHGEHPGRERLLPLLAMESRARETHQRQVSASTDTRRGHGSDQHHYQGDGGSTYSDPLPQCETAECGGEGSSTTILPLRELAQRTCCLDARSIHEIEQQLCLDLNCGETSDGESQAQFLGRADFEDASGSPITESQGAIAEWQLINDGNMCYLNTTWLCMIWTISHLAPVSDRLRPLLDTSTQLAAARSPTILRHHVLAFQRGWQNVMLQQDVAEYLSHILSTSNVEMGEWEAHSA